MAKFSAYCAATILIASPLFGVDPNLKVPAITHYEQAAFVPHRLHPNEFWIVGVHRYTESVKQHYTVIVPGQEGTPVRPETRTRLVKIPQERSIARPIQGLTLWDTRGKRLDFAEARKKMESRKQFVYIALTKPFPSDAGSFPIQELTPYGADMLVVVDAPAKDG